jgi:hypothetical protein
MGVLYSRIFLQYRSQLLAVILLMIVLTEFASDLSIASS